MATAVAPPENGGWRESSGEEEERCVERTTSEQECDLMLEALCRELGEIKNQLAWLTYHLDEGPDEPNEREISGRRELTSHISSRSSRRSAARSGADTPHTAKKKMERTKEAIERATKAALAARERKRHFMEVVERAEETQRQFNERYLSLLQVHVEQQKQRVLENSEKLLRRMKMRERREKAVRLKKKPARYRSLPSDNDTTFLKKLYHSTYYQIIGVELEMKRTGKLQRLSEMKEFWQLMLGPPISTPTQPLTTRSKATPTQHKPHPLIEEEEEYEEGEYQSWALTNLPPEKETRVSEREFQKLKTPTMPLRLPQVCSISSLLSEASTTQENSIKKRERDHRQRMEKVEWNRRHTRHMYQQARANEMAMRSLLPDIGSLGIREDSEKLSDLAQQQTTVSSQLKDHTADSAAGRGTGRKETVQQSRPHMRGEKSLQGPLPKSTNPEMGSSEVKEEEGKLSQSRRVVVGTEKDARVAPLTMNTLLDSGGVKESKGKSVLWSNYK